MQREPLVSIIVNNYNYGHFLEEAIDSALNQTYRHTEVIVVDDGSRDNSPEIIAGYRNRIIPLLKENGGQASAFNAGFSVSRGDIVIFLDADDILFPEAIEEVAKVWHPGLALVLYQLDLMNANGQFKGVHPPSDLMPSGDLRDYILSSGDYISPPTSGMAFSRHVLLGLFPVPEEEYRIGADTYLRLSSPFYGEVIPLCNRLGIYRIHGSNEVATLSTIDKIRKQLESDCGKQKLLGELGNRLGLEVPDNLFVGSPKHFKRRIASLRLDP